MRKGSSRPENVSPCFRPTPYPQICQLVPIYTPKKSENAACVLSQIAKTVFFSPSTAPYLDLGYRRTSKCRTTTHIQMSGRARAALRRALGRCHRAHQPFAWYASAARCVCSPTTCSIAHPKRYFTTILLGNQQFPRWAARDDNRGKAVLSWERRGGRSDQWQRQTTTTKLYPLPFWYVLVGKRSPAVFPYGNAMHNRQYSPFGQGNTTRETRYNTCPGTQSRNFFSFIHGR